MPPVIGRNSYNTLAARLGLSGGDVVAGAPRVVQFTTAGASATVQDNGLIGATQLLVTLGGVQQYLNTNYTFVSGTGTITWVEGAPEDGLNGTIQY